MIACLSIPVFSLRAALRGRPDLRERPVALAPDPGGRPHVGTCTAAAEAEGIRAGMRLSEALALCPDLVVVEQDPAAVEEAWERVLRRLEDAGLAVEPEWEARVGAGTRRFTALAAASVAPPHRILVVDDDESALFLEPLPLDLLTLTPDRRRDLSELGIRRLGELAGLPGAAVADRLGADGAEAWRIVSGADGGRVSGRTPPGEIVEELEFPEAIGNELTLGRALSALVDRLLARPERGGRAPRRVAISARLVGGGSWRRSLTFREPTAEPKRLRIALEPKLAELTAPVVALRLELGELADSVGTQSELVRPRGSRLRERLRDGLQQARLGAGLDAVCTVVEVAPWSRIPESRAILVPRDD